MALDSFEIPAAQLPDFMKHLTNQVVAAVRAELSSGVQQEYLKFPEDIAALTGNHVPVGTIRRWKTDGYLRTFKLGIRTFVKFADWEWFRNNHGELMKADPRNKGSRLKGGGGGEK